MNDDQLPGDELDDAATATLDGTATPDQRALAATALGRTRVEELRAVAAAVATDPPALDPAQVEAAVGAALDAYDEGAPIDGTGTGPAPVPLPVGRARRRSSARWLAPAAAAAAALLLVVGVVGALRSGDDAETTSTALVESATTAPNAAGDVGAGADAASSADLAAPAAPPRAAPLDGGDVGRIADPAALAQRVADALEGASSGDAVRASEPRSEVARCTERASAVAPVPLTALRYRAAGTYEGQRVVVLAYDRRDGPLRILLLLDAGNCDLVTDQDF